MISVVLCKIFRLVRPPYWCFAIHLGLVLNLVRFAYLLPLSACARHCCTVEACNLVSPHQLCLWNGHLARKGGNKARGIWAKSMIVKTTGSSQGKGPIETHLHVEKAHRLYGVTWSEAWLLQALPCKGSNEDYWEHELFNTIGKIPSSMEVCISISFKLLHLIACLIVYFTFLV
jgi:hypothetical protein